MGLGLLMHFLDGVYSHKQSPCHFSSTICKTRERAVEINACRACFATLRSGNNKRAGSTCVDKKKCRHTSWRRQHRTEIALSVFTTGTEPGERAMFWILPEIMDGQLQNSPLQSGVNTRTSGNRCDNVALLIPNRIDYNVQNLGEPGHIRKLYDLCVYLSLHIFLGYLTSLFVPTDVCCLCRHRSL